MAIRDINTKSDVVSLYKDRFPCENTFPEGIETIVSEKTLIERRFDRPYVSFMKYVLPFLLLLLTACQSAEDRFAESWSTMDLDLERRDGLPADSAAGETLVRLYPDGRSVYYTGSGRYVLSTWELSQEQIYLHRETLALPLLRLPVYTFFDGSWSARLPGNERIVTFHKKPYLEYRSDDLLAPERNKWRLRSPKPLSDEELEEKVRSHLQYAADYFDLIIRKEQPYFEPRLLVLPFQFYRGGIGMRTFATAPEPWKALFYDEREALRAYSLYLKALRKTNTLPSGKKRPDLMHSFRRALERMAGEQK